MGLLSPPISGICKVKTAFNALGSRLIIVVVQGSRLIIVVVQGSRLIIVVAQLGVMKIYVAAVEALRKKGREDETPFTTKIDGFLSFIPR